MAMAPQFEVRVLPTDGIARREPRVEHVGTFWRPRWRVVDAVELVYRFDGFGELRVRVDAGFETDFATVPRFLWWLFPPQSIYNLAALFHDRLCESGCDRTLADEIFRVLLVLIGAPRMVRWPMYRAVRTYGLASQACRSVWTWLLAAVVILAVGAATALAGEEPSRAVPVPEIEVNHFRLCGCGDGCPHWQHQLIFRHRDGAIAQWAWLRDCRDLGAGMWDVRHAGTQYVVHSPNVTQTWTEYDAEVYEQNWLTSWRRTPIFGGRP
jgi:hypothetical protein